MADEFLSDQDLALGVEDFPSARDYKLHSLRQWTSHIMASAVQQIFPEAKFGIGSPIKNGFYYVEKGEANFYGPKIESDGPGLIETRTPARHDPVGLSAPAELWS